MDWENKLGIYLYEKYLIRWNIFIEINFELPRLYIPGQSRVFQLWVTKHWPGFCGIERKMKHMKPWDNESCP